MENLFIHILNISITAGWLILAVIAARFLLKKAPRKITVLLWGLVALRLLIPFSIESKASLVPSAETISPTIGYATRPQISSGISVVNNTVNPVLVETFAATPHSSVNPMQILLSIGSLVWILGMAALLLYAIVSALRLRRKVREAVPRQENIWLCDQVETPFVMGIFRPRILLPSGLSESETEYVLAHERAHLARKDYLWKPLAYLLLTIYWFHPLVWVAYILLCRDIEAATDEKVIRDMSLADKKAYALALVSCSRQQKAVLACPLAFGEIGVKERVKGVLNYKKPGFWIILAAVAAILVIAICFLTNPKAKAADPLDYKNALSLIQENGFALEHFSAETGKKVTGITYQFQLTQYLSNADWTETTVPDDMPDSDYLQILPSEDFKITVFHTPAIARVQTAGKERFYKTGDKDYAALLDLFRESSSQDDSRMDDIEKFRTENVGNAPKVAQIARRLPYPDGLSYVSIKLWTETEPYGMDVYLKNQGGRSLEETAAEFPKCADMAFDLIENLGSLRFYTIDDFGDKFRMFSCSRQSEEIPYGIFTDGNWGSLSLSHVQFLLNQENPKEHTDRPWHDFFRFSYDMLSSYMPEGTVVRSGNKLVCRTDDGQQYFTFRIKDEDTLVFDAQNSSEITYIDNRLVGKGEEVTVGSEFRRREEANS